MASIKLINTIKYIDQHSFEGMVYEELQDLAVAGKQFAIATVSHYAECQSYDALIKFIEDKGGIVKPNAVKSADYLIITPSPTMETAFVRKEEQEKYEKAIACRKTKGTPRIIRDVDFYIAQDMFSKLAIDDKRRLVMEYLNGNPNFTEKSTKKIVDFITKKAKDDAYLQTKDTVMAIASQQVKGEESKKNQLPDQDTGTLQQWRKHFSLSEGIYMGKTGLILKKCKTLQPTIRIPSNIEGKPIICVDKKAFTNLDDSVKEVVIPVTVVAVENFSFFHCAGLHRIVFENPECYIPVYSFAECANLTEILMNGENIAGEVVRLGGQNYTSIKHN